MGIASQLRIRLMLFIPRIRNKPYCKYQEYSGIMFMLSSKVKKKFALSTVKIPMIVKICYLLSFWRNNPSCCPHCSTKVSNALSFPELNVGVIKALRFFHCWPLMLTNIFLKYGEVKNPSVGRSTKCSKSRTVISLMSSGSRIINIGRRPS